MVTATLRSGWDLVRVTADRRRLTLLVLSSLLAGVVGFVTVSPPLAETLIAQGGYYYMAGLFTLLLGYAWRVIKAVQAGRATGLRRFGNAAEPSWRTHACAIGTIAIASAYAIWCDPFRHKILFDEFVLQGTAYHMHVTKEIGTIIRAYDLAGTWLPVDTFLDKRPYFFTFLVSLVHDLTGYRLANMFILNVALAPVFFAGLYWLAATLAGRGAAILAVLLMATMPLTGQQATGAGMELHNLVMLLGVMIAAVLYLDNPNADRMGLLLVSTVLLAQSRYESVLFVGSTAIVIFIGWLRSGRVLLTWTLLLAPLLLVPYAWHNRVLSATPLLWQLHEGQTSRFSLDYLAANLEGAWIFFFNATPNLANSWYLSAIGLLGVIWALGRAWRWARARPPQPAAPAVIVLVAFGAGIVANITLLMFYYWSRLDDVIASRFALPVCVLLALLAAMAAAAWERPRLPTLRLAGAGLAIWLAGWGFPVLARHTYTSQNLVMQEVEWEHDELARRPGPLLFISNKSTIPFVLWRIPTIINGVGRLRARHIKYHMDAGTFREVIVAQALRPTTPQGDMGVDPDDLMPPTYRLETIAQKRFGARWSRLSRLVAIDLPPPHTSASSSDTAVPGLSPVMSSTNAAVPPVAAARQPSR